MNAAADLVLTRPRPRARGVRMTASKTNRCCIRVGSLLASWLAMSVPVAAQTAPSVGPDIVCLLYTSDAADD